MPARRLLAPTTVALGLLLATARIVLAQPADDGGAVVDAFQRARSAGDLNAALAEFADDAVITVQAGPSTQVFAGRDQVQAYLHSTALPTRTLMHSAYRSDGAYVRWVERDEDGQQTTDATAQAIVQSGHISMLVLERSVLYPGPGAADATATEPTHQAPGLAWAAALGSACTLLVGLVFRPRRRTSASTLDGRLFAAMRRTSLPNRRVARTS